MMRERPPVRRHDENLLRMRQREADLYKSRASALTLEAHEEQHIASKHVPANVLFPVALPLCACLIGVLEFPIQPLRVDVNAKRRERRTQGFPYRLGVDNLARYVRAHLTLASRAFRRAASDRRR